MNTCSGIVRSRRAKHMPHPLPSLQEPTMLVRAAAIVWQAPCVRAVHTASVQRARYDSILDTIGSTPVVRINNIAPKDVTVYAKCEFMNPLSSVKDRLALGVIEWAEKKGLLKPGDTVVEATSGNTGIATAMVCAARGYGCVITMAESFSVERRRVMRMLGAQVVLTPAPAKGSGMVAKAEELAAEHGFFYLNQFVVQANPDTHEKTTGAEILADFEGQQLDYFVTGYGTGGTFQGVSKAIKSSRPEVKVILSEPENAALVSSGVPQKRKEVLGVYGAAAESHPAFTPHPIQGWTPDFIPAILESGLGLENEVVQVTGPEAIAMSQKLAAHEGIFTGVSGGATMATALKVAETAPQGSVLLAMLPDTAERYLSTPLFESIPPEMNDAEKALFNSTPLFKE